MARRFAELVLVLGAAAAGACGRVTAPRVAPGTAVSASAETGLGDAALAGAPGAQGAPAIAFDGSIYLVAWTDRRSGAAGEVWAARVAPGGTVLDPVGIPVAIGPGERRSVSVAAGEAGFLVAWHASGDSLPDAVRAARISAGGEVLDAPALTLDDAASALTETAAAWDGSAFRVAWVAAPAGVEPVGPVRTARVGAGSEIARSAASPGDARGRERLALACGEGACAVAWVAPDGVRAAALDADGAPLAPPADVARAARTTAPALARGEGGWLVAWEDDRLATGIPEIRTARLDASGEVVDPGGTPRSTDEAHAPAVAHDGSRFVVAWEDRTPVGGDVVTLRVDGAGVALDPAPFPACAAPGAQREVAVAASPAGFLLAFADGRVDASGDVFAALVTGGGAVVDDAIRISSSPSRQTRPAIAAGPAGALAVWVDARDADHGGATVRAARLAPDGTLLDATPFAPDAAVVQDAPAAAWCGDAWIVAWADHRATTGPDVRVAWVAPDATVLRAGAVTSAPGPQVEPSVSCGPDAALVTWQDARDGLSYELRGARVVLASGAVLDPGGVAISRAPTAGRRAAVAWSGAAWTVAWAAPEGGAPGRVWVARISADASVSPPAAACAAPAEQSEPVLSADAGGLLLGWTQDGAGSPRLRAGRLEPGGAALDPCGIELSPGAAAPAIAFGGARHVVAFRDPTADEVRCVEVEPGEGIASEFAISAEGGERAPAVACGSWGCVALYERPAAGVSRVYARALGVTPAAPACAADGECATGHCVDRVCCDTECGGGDPSDCVACSAAAGAAADGTCGPALARHLCRQSASACDAVERCDGVGSACPGDAPAPDGSACDDGDGCTRADACAGGACAGADPVVCESTACAAGVCDPTTGACAWAAVPVGTPCDDGDVCTAGDACGASGSCEGAPRCVPPDDCHVAACDAATGACTIAAKADGVPCDDGSLCTTASRCSAGVCVGTATVECASPGPCQQEGLCDRATGACVFAPKPDGAPCDDGTACTRADACVAGTCRGSDPVICETADACNHAGRCDPATGACTREARPDGTWCDDGNACTYLDACAGGACVGGSPVQCWTPDDCHAGVCDPTTGSCSTVAKPDGSACDDGQACTRDDACAAGQCRGAQVTCPAPDACHAAACDPSTGACGAAWALPDGAACPGGACRDGACQPSSSTPPGPGGGCGCGVGDGATPSLALLGVLALAPRRRRAAR